MNQHRAPVASEGHDFHIADFYHGPCHCCHESGTKIITATAEGGNEQLSEEEIGVPDDGGLMSVTCTLFSVRAKVYNNPCWSLSDDGPRRTCAPKIEYWWSDTEEKIMFCVIKPSNLTWLV